MSVSVGLTKRNTFTNSKNTGDFSIANSSHTFFISFSTKLETSTFLNPLSKVLTEDIVRAL